ncbi:lamin tail domain-containing protein [candidate division KSB1 bacterium]|nr:lamin tail domain-containing protein [candidate division KSB1 bacterium]
MKKLTAIIVILLWTFANLSHVLAQNPGDVIINEIMYDPKDENEEWVELYNATNSAIDISGWIITDDNTYPSLSGEGKLTIPDGTTIPAGGFVILSEKAITEISGEIICTQTGSYGLANGGDNLALYTAATGGTLIDGSLSVNFPIDASDGESIEKIDPSQGWSGNTIDWDASTNNFGGTNHVYCTPGSANSVWETTPPCDVSSFTATNPTDNSINLSWTNPADADFTGTLILKKTNSAPTGTPADHTAYSVGNAIGDGIIVYIGDGQSYIDTGLDPNTPYFYKAFAYDEVRNYANGVLANESTIPVELTLFTTSIIEGKVILQWITQTETENLGFHVYRSKTENGEYANISRELIKGTGNSDQAHTYSYTDKDVEAGNTYYYKLADINFNGNMNFHGPISATVNAQPNVYSLAQNYPNPFNSSTAINFSLKEKGTVVLKIHNLQGQLIRTIFNEEKSAGDYSVIWDGIDEAGNEVASNVYLYTLQINEFKQTKKLIFLK